MNPFRFGVNVRTAASAADWIALARELEDLEPSIDAFAPVVARLAGR